MYTNATSTLPGPDWSGTSNSSESTVSSTFMHLAPFRARLPLRPTSVVPDVPDGMREYSLDERIVGANTMWANTANDVGKACQLLPDAGGLAGTLVLGGVLGLFGGPSAVVLGANVGQSAGELTCAQLQANIANQVTNCFAFDACDDLSQRWKNPGKGATVSPDDLLAWDLPVNGGSYGYNEPSQYLPTTFRRRYAWRKEAGVGAITVRVVNENGAPFRDARVTLNGIQVGGSGADGVVVAPAVAAGNYDVEAQFSPCGAFLPPAPTPPGPAPSTLPVCPREGPVPAQCQSGFGQGCPRGFRPGQCEEGVYRIVNDEGQPGPVTGNGSEVPRPPAVSNSFGYEQTCACVAPQPPACNQALLRAAKPAIVSAGGNVNVLLTLCAGPPVFNGLGCGAATDCPFANTCELGLCVNPAGCRQSCDSDADCFDVLTCNPTTKLCEPKAAVADISGGVNLQAYDKDILQSATRTPYSLFTNLRCDPVINGGNVSFGFCGKDADGDDAIQYIFNARCTQDPTSGLFTVANDARLDKGCGTNAEGQNNVSRWNVGLPPPTPSNPSPTVVASGGRSCWGGTNCSENYAFFDLTYATKRKP